jgi:hypothetical protein
MESHLAQCSACREKLAVYRLASAGELAPAVLEQARERVWQRLSGPEMVDLNQPNTAYNSENFRNLEKFRNSETVVFWRRKFSLPFPVAAAAAAILLIAMAALWLRPIVIDARDTAIAASENLDMRGMAPLTDMSGVLQYLGSKEDGDYVILRLPESRNFMSSGEPAIIKAADYSRRNSGR